MKLIIDESVAKRFPELIVPIRVFQEVIISKSHPDLERFKEEVYARIKGKYTIESLKDSPRVRAYRDFFWRIGIDPTKNRPSAEALIRRILAEKPIPQINTLVDAYNLASAEVAIPMAAFDLDRLEGELVMRFAKNGEEFLGIGMSHPISLKGGEVVISDKKKLVAIYPYRDAEYSKVTETTKNVLLLVCGVPKIDIAALKDAADVATDYILRFCDGVKSTSKVK